MTTLAIVLFYFRWLKSSRLCPPEHKRKMNQNPSLLRLRHRPNWGRIRHSIRPPSWTRGLRPQGRERPEGRRGAYFWGEGRSRSKSPSPHPTFESYTPMRGRSRAGLETRIWRSTSKRLATVHYWTFTAERSAIDRARSFSVAIWTFDT